jgi:hypothetical protein
MAESVQTGETVWYLFPSLAAGTYTPIIERAGFRRDEEQGVDASAQRAINLRLEIGAGSALYVVGQNRALKSRTARSRHGYVTCMS